MKITDTQRSTMQLLRSTLAGRLSEPQTRRRNPVDGEIKRGGRGKSARGIWDNISVKRRFPVSQKDLEISSLYDRT